jgi:hypothetical protein
MTSTDAAPPFEDGHDVSLELGRRDHDVRQAAGWRDDTFEVGAGARHGGHHQDTHSCVPHWRIIHRPDTRPVRRLPGA